MSDEEFDAEIKRQMDELGIPEPQSMLMSPKQAEMLQELEGEE